MKKASQCLHQQGMSSNFTCSDRRVKGSMALNTHLPIQGFRAGDVSPQRNMCTQNAGGIGFKVQTKYQDFSTMLNSFKESIDTTISTELSQLCKQQQNVKDHVFWCSGIIVKVSRSVRSWQRSRSLQETVCPPHRGCMATLEGAGMG